MMKHIVLISLMLLLPLNVSADDRMPADSAPHVVIAKTNAEQRALTETLAAKIKSALLGERYTLDCRGRCER
jgi:hypothetical protein